jgi:hypothetical protein
MSEPAERKTTVVSFALPEELVDVMNATLPAPEVPEFVAEAIRHKLQMRGLDAIIADYESRHGPLPTAAVDAAEAQLLTSLKGANARTA